MKFIACICHNATEKAELQAINENLILSFRMIHSQVFLSTATY